MQGPVGCQQFAQEPTALPGSPPVNIFWNFTSGADFWMPASRRSVSTIAAASESSMATEPRIM